MAEELSDMYLQLQQTLQYSLQMVTYQEIHCQMCSRYKSSKLTKKKSRHNYDTF